MIKRGLFISKVITDWDKDESIIAQTFQKLLATPGITGDGYCLERYEGESDMRCMVPLDETAISQERKDLLWLVNDSFDKLCRVLSSFAEDQINRVPFEGS